ncbi:TlpA family protein disulfide reductase [Algibacter sp. Ld11]|uniref:TlpA family protein disulfide reductase n=1 Tax=Algibacter sp. Ld11 TaxID=649150 RepID=UPI0038673366
MKKIIIVLVISIFSFGCKETPLKANKTVKLSGTIVNYTQDTLYMDNVTSKDMLFIEDIQPIILDNKTSFNYTFELDKPAYFQIGRTFLYLSPGDSLVANLDTNGRDLASFTGKGAEANNYLRMVPYPKGGSYWGNRAISSSIKTYQDMPEAFKKAAKIRLDELNQVTNVSEEFKHLEKARIKFDYVNSLNSVIYLYISKLMSKQITQEEADKIKAEAEAYFVPYVKEYLDDFNNIEYLQLETFQSVLYVLKDDEFRAKHNLPELSPKLSEYILTNELINELKFNGYSNEAGNKLKEGIKQVVNQDYVEVLKKLQSEYETITKGNPASDLTFTKLDGSTVKLSDYKGKVIVLDLWATWCGPCMAEKPFFEALEKKYQEDNNVELISLSIDTEKVWQAYFKKNKVVGNQLQINRSQLTNYKVAGIPRFFVIDKNFNIIDVYAPLPSSGDLETLINQYK